MEHQGRCMSVRTLSKRHSAVAPSRHQQICIHDTLITVQNMAGAAGSHHTGTNSRCGGTCLSPQKHPALSSARHHCLPPTCSPFQNQAQDPTFIAHPRHPRSIPHKNTDTPNKPIDPLPFNSSRAPAARTAAKLHAPCVPLTACPDSRVANIAFPPHPSCPICQSQL
jgi:hypothetical protein